MENIKETGLELFLQHYGYETDNLDNKQKLIYLKEILYNNVVSEDLADIKYSKISEINKTNDVKEQYISEIKNLKYNQMLAREYIVYIRSIRKEARKLRFKEIIKKPIKKVISLTRNKNM